MVNRVDERKANNQGITIEQARESEALTQSSCGDEKEKVDVRNIWALELTSPAH